MTAPWVDGEELTAAVMYARTTALISALPTGMLGSSTAGAAVTLSTTSAFASTCKVTFTLTAQRRVKFTGVMGRYNPGSGGGNARIQVGYNTGNTANIASFVGTGAIVNASQTAAQAQGQSAEGDALLSPGTYTAYLSITRVGGAATDTADNFYVLVEDDGSS